ncbi:DAK2 domain-containing protein [Gulosibacter faecalis]|jgi:dihydroxyacetone kinase-like protein|uniref:DAK2 domain-containing protein n=1 Tax=Gulosibacter faecalis TaxID=272240 RepID=A0ABW5UW42_9MICO|nr:DAK2 domain-containing protein [Gulosibacter faecalis]
MTSTSAFEALRDAATELLRDLTHFDQVSGDGDFGENLRGAADLVVATLARRPDDDEYRVAADVFLDDVGGTSGPLFGLLLQAIASCQESGERDWLRIGLARGTEAIQRVGEAEPGDRTLVDALVPAVRALEAGESAGQAAKAAADAAVATATMRARRGRSSYVGDRALGVPDPGCVGVAVLLWAIASVEPGATRTPVREFLPAQLQLAE